MKTKTCPECEGIMEARTDCHGKAIWACRCCWIESPRKVYSTTTKRAREQKADEFAALIDELAKN